MDVISEIDRYSARRKRDHLAHGREDEDFLGDQAFLQGIHVVVGVAHIALPFKKLTEPGQANLKDILPFLRRALFIAPVGRDAVFCRPVHLLGPDLNFKGNPPVTDDGSVKRLIAVCLGHGDVVTESSGNGLVKLVHKTENSVAFTDGWNDDPGGE